MKILVGTAGGWIGFSVAEKILFDGRMTLVLPSLARSIASGFGLHW